MTANHAPVMLTRSPRGGSVEVRYSRVERWDVVDGRAPVWRRPANLKLAAAVLGGVGIGAAIALAFSGPSHTPVSAGEASVDLSPAVAEIPPVSMPARAIPAPATRPAHASPVIAAAVIPAAAVPAAATVVDRPGPDSESAALAQAFSSNESVSWRNATATGTVVVGVAAIENGRYCRDVAVLTRADGVADRTVNGRKCLEPGGRITDQAAPTPQ